MRCAAILISGAALLSSVALVSGAALALAGPASAQGLPAFDPNGLPAYKGQVQLFTLTPHGDIDGMVLADGTEVKTPPHLSTALALVVRPGDKVTIHGLKAARLPLVQAVSVTNDATGRSVVDRGPDAGSPRPAGPADGSQPVTGRIRMALHGVRGDVNGVLLEDGTVLKLSPLDADRFRAVLLPGHMLTAQGTLRVTVAGRVLDVTALGVTPDKLQPLD